MSVYAKQARGLGELNTLYQEDALLHTFMRCQTSKQDKQDEENKTGQWGREKGAVCHESFKKGYLLR